MSRIAIPDLSERASARIGSTYARAALARHTTHPYVERYQPLRTPWVHGFFPGAGGRLGALFARDVERAIEAAIDPEHVEEAIALATCPVMLPGEDPFLYNQRLHQQDPPLTVRQIQRCSNLLQSGGRLPAPRPPGAAPRPTTPAPTSALRILDTGGALSLGALRDGGGLVQVTPIVRQAGIVGPVWLEALHIDPISEGGGAFLIYHVTIPGIGFTWQWTDAGSNPSGVSIDIPLRFLSRAAVQIEARVEATANTPAGMGPAGFSVILTYRNVSGGRRTALPPETSAEVAAAIADADIPDDWYIIRTDTATGETLTFDASNPAF
jgi:hypothetical protein